jgi:hypothetical protein
MANKGGMATGIEVARISVKVSPDTRKFRSELLAELAEIEKTVKSTVNVTAKANTGKAEAQLNNAARDRTAKVKVDVDGGKQLDNLADSDWQKVLIERARAMRTSITPNANNANERKRLRELLDEMKSYEGRFSDNFGPDTKVLKARWQATLNEIEASTRPIKVKAKLDVDKDVLSDEFYTAVKAAVSAAGKGGKAAVDAGKGLADIIAGSAGGGLGAGGGKSKLIPKFGSGLNASAIGLVVAAGLAAIGPVVGFISTSLLALPGLISLMLTPIAAVTLGLDGFKKAAEAIKPEFEELQATMNKASEESFTPVLKQLANQIFPRLKQSLPGVTQGLAEMSKGLIDGLDDGRFNAIIDRIGQAFASLRPGVQSFTSGFMGLVDQFTAKLPGITQWINEAGAGFDAWVQKVSADGSLQSALANTGTIIQQIASTLTNIGKKGIEFMSDPKNVQLTLDVLKGVENTAIAILDVSEDISQKWASISDKFGWVKDISNAFNSRGEGDKPFDQQAIGQKLGGGLGYNFQQQLKAAFGDDEAKKYIDQFYADVETKSGEAGTKSANAFSSGIGVGSAAGVPLDTAAMAAESQPKIQPPNTEEASAKLQEYNQLVDETAAKVKASLSESMGSGDAVPPPDLSAFKSGLDQLPGLASQAMANVAVSFANGIQGIVSALDAGSQAILAIVTAWPTMITAALSAMNAIGYAAGMQLAAGMAQGIADGQSYVITAAVAMAVAAKVAAEGALGIESPSKVFAKIGGYTAEGFAVGMEKGFGPVLAQAKDMAWKISEAFANGTDPTDVISGMGGKEVTRVGKALALEAKRLEVQAKALTYQSKITGDESLKARAEELRMQKEGIVLQKEMLDLTQDYADLSGEGKFSESPLGEAVQTLMNMPQDFLGAMGEQVMSDFGIQGGGALSSIADYGMGLANNFVFNVQNLDEAMAVHQNQVNKQGMGVVGR